MRTGALRRAPMLMLIDYSSLLFRTFHTIPASVPMHAVYGFLNMLARLKDAGVVS